MKNLLLVITVSLSLLHNSCSDKSGQAEKRSIQNAFDRVRLEGQSNFRDLGGIKTTGGNFLKTGMLFRSGTLSKLTESDVKKLEELKIKTVVNFLTEEERRATGEDRLPDDVKSIFLPISGENNEASLVLKARQNGDFSEVPEDFNYKIHYLLIDDGKTAYTGLFEVLSNPENFPVVFHCSHGVHRTGTATALVLSAIDIPWKEIENDYLLSNDCRKDEINLRINSLQELAIENPGIEDKNLNKQNIEAFYRLRPDYLEGTKKAIEENYGNFDTYLRSLGVSNDALYTMRELLLEKDISDN